MHIAISLACMTPITRDDSAVLQNMICCVAASSHETSSPKGYQIYQYHDL